MRGSFIQAEATHALLTFYIMAEVCRIDPHPAFTKSFTPTFRSKFWFATNAAASDCGWRLTGKPH